LLKYVTSKHLVRYRFENNFVKVLLRSSK